MAEIRTSQWREPIEFYHQTARPTAKVKRIAFARLAQASLAAVAGKMHSEKLMLSGSIRFTDGRLWGPLKASLGGAIDSPPITHDTKLASSMGHQA